MQQYDGVQILVMSVEKYKLYDKIDSVQLIQEKAKICLQ